MLFRFNPFSRCLITNYGPSSLLAFLLCLSIITHTNVSTIQASAGGDTTDATELLSRARYSLVNGNQPGARLALAELGTRFPGFHRTERMLLDARWRLAEHDSSGFEQGYFETLMISAQSDDFETLLQDLKPVFTPNEAQRWETLDSPVARVLFIKKFWRSRDPDPISQENPRLSIHYARLLEAQGNYSSPVYERSPLSRNHGAGQGPQYDPTAPLADFPFVQPNPKFKRPSGYQLAPRGILYLRHGPPDRIVHGSSPKTGGDSETWYYGNSSFTFESQQGYDTFSAVPASGTLDGPEINGATDTAGPENNYQRYYAAEFKARGDSVGLEFYQSFPRDSLETGAVPEAVVALFDTTWRQVAISRSPARKMTAGPDTLWMAVNSLKTLPGTYYYVLRMDLAPVHPVIRNSMNIMQFTADSINLSGIIFGHPLDIDKTIPNRSAEGLLPRPSLIFTTGEVVSVYFEIYGLKPNRDGGREYREVITVSKVSPSDSEEDENFSGNAETLKRWTENRSNSRIFSFDRSSGDQQKIISEHFNIDTSDLEAGSYSLHLEVEDKNTGELREVNWFFDLTASTNGQPLEFEF
jgi:hypothetical protein